MWKNEITWIIGEDEFDETSESEAQLMKFMEQSRSDLESTLLDDKYESYKYKDIIYQTIKEIFWDNWKDIIINNRFLLILDNIIREIKSNDDTKNINRKNLLLEEYIIQLNDYISEYWIAFFEKLNEKNKNKSPLELSRLRNTIKSEFIQKLIIIISKSKY